MKRTVLLWALCCVLLLSSVAPVLAVPIAAEGVSYKTTVTRLWGDVDEDGALTSTDARLILQYVTEKINGEELTGDLADVDGDGEVTTTDARLVLQYAVDKIDGFPVGAEKTDEYKIVIITRDGYISEDRDDILSTEEQPVFTVDPDDRLFVYENGEKTAQAVVWSSDNPEEIAIEEDGTISDVTPGKRAVITAEIENGISLQIAVYTHAFGLIIEPDRIFYQVVLENGETRLRSLPMDKPLYVSLEDSQTLQLAFLVKEEDYADYSDKVQWITTDPLVATLDANGLVTFHATGQVTVMAGIGDYADYVDLIVE